ncbi:hypothetical protein G6F59_016590 [Rhizopus arrhizus]|nr:hypothetical protein G6F59_016590 [Rhizopus arrhizus]
MPRWSAIPEFHGDADRLTQAVWNLVRNAIQAGAGSITLRTRVEHGVRIAEKLHTLALRLEIADDGRGVPEELAEHLFLPLVSGRAEGTGLGVAAAGDVALLEVTAGRQVDHHRAARVHQLGGGAR